MNKWIVYGSFATIILTGHDARAQGLPGLPVEGAPVAQSGPYEVASETAFGSPGHVVFRPADLDGFPERDTLPVIAWGNGGCAKDSEPYAGLLTTIASHGFLVLATAVEEGEQLGPPAVILGDDGVVRVQAPPAALRAALDWAEAEAAREGSPLQGRVATDLMAVMGQSCGGQVAIGLGADARVDTIGAFNAGAPPAWPNASSSPLPTIDALDDLHGPVLLVNGHETDGAMEASRANYEAIDDVPAFYGARREAGHFGTIGHPGGGEYANVASSWLKWILKGDAEAGAMFVGEDCGLCADPNWEVRSKRLE